MWGLQGSEEHCVEPSSALKRLIPRVKDTGTEKKQGETFRLFNRVLCAVSVLFPHRIITLSASVGMVLENGYPKPSWLLLSHL